MKKKRKKKTATKRLSLRKDLTELQYEFGEFDLLTRPRVSELGRMEFLVVALERIGIRMEPDKNHKRPHIHISYGKLRHVASYAIDTGERLAGELERKYDHLVKEWIEGRRQKLMKLWDHVQAGKNPEALVLQLRGES